MQSDWQGAVRAVRSRDSAAGRCRGFLADGTELHNSVQNMSNIGFECSFDAVSIEHSGYTSCVLVGCGNTPQQSGYIRNLKTSIS